MVWNGTTYTIEVMYMIAMQTLLHVTTTELNPLGKEQFCTKPKASIQSVSCKERHNAILKSFQQHFWGSEPDLLVMNLFFSGSYASTVSDTKTKASQALMVQYQALHILMCRTFTKVEIYLIYFFWKINAKFPSRIRDAAP